MFSNGELGLLVIPALVRCFIAGIFVGGPIGFALGKWVF